ncbi:glutathione S-transferase family protein [Roseofilum casamattae]|uniref:Glutathione S-transferase family protein n=1 Tax=Roseofilum casamattae BLCC-M143 TaxID=3022442 RepID=A0ABT7BU52_9CYAN|nr:glutathione S-transferase family protein [Roseofilum casamattae]MDJ1182717.1 glutathione S-transferase family protein [Roseofilum casamattae BLCC-M143]
MAESLSVRIIGTIGVITSLLVPIEAIAKPLSVSQDSGSELQLYGGPRTRSPLVQWYLEELNVPYRYISLNLRENEHQTPEYLAINPMGKVPALVDEDFTVWESGAILLYLAEKYGDFPDTLEARSRRVQWVLFANATLGPGLFLPERRDREIPRLLAPLNEILSQQPFLLGSSLDVADIAIASYLYYAQMLAQLDYGDYPAIVDYLERITARTAFQNTLGKRFAGS